MAIQDDLTKLINLLEEKDKKKVKEKKFRFPSNSKVKGNQRKKNFVTVLTILENGTYNFKKYKIEDQTIMHDLIPKLATAGHISYDSRGNPMLIIANWSTEPITFNSLINYERSLVDGSNVKGYKILMAKMRLETVQQKKPMSGWIKWVIGLGLAAIIIYAIMTTGSK